MIYNFAHAKVHYRYIERGAKQTLVFLHGWGRSGEDFQEFVPLFDSHNILLIDFPPFGESIFEKPFPSIFTYVNMLISLCEHLKIASADFISHSFGGRILILLSILNSSLVQKCIFVDSAGLKPKRNLKYKTKVLRYKIAKKFHKKVCGGSRDYLALSPDMKDLFKNIVNTHLDGFAKKIKKSSLIVWGEKDGETPLYMAKRLNKFIVGSKLVILKDCGHFAFLEKKLEFFDVVNKFLKEKK